MSNSLLKKRIPSDPDLTSGTIVDKVLLFAIPLMLTSMLQQLFNATDIAVVGKFASMEAMAAVGSNTPVVSLLVNWIIGALLNTWAFFKRDWRSRSLVDELQN